MADRQFPVPFLGDINEEDNETYALPFVGDFTEDQAGEPSAASLLLMQQGFRQ